MYFGGVMKNQIKFDASKFEMEIIIKIAQRAVAMAKKYGSTDYRMQDALMDIEACHCNGNALELDRLLAADDLNFSHDVFGIRRHLNRRTGELENYFVPRCSLPQHTTA